MRQLTTALVLALSLIGCGFAQPEVRFNQDLNDSRNCLPEKFVVGQLVSVPGTAIQDDQGMITPLIWPSSYSLRSSPGWLTREFEVLDETGIVIATSGRRYKIGGADFAAAGSFWACADVIPQ